MRNRIVIVTDLGTLKAYRLARGEQDSAPHLELVDGFDTMADEKLSDQLTDQAGRFPRGSAGPGAMGELSNGERHNLKLEIERRVVKKLAERMNTLLRAEDIDGCYFAANNEINRQIMEHLSPQARAKIEKNVGANLTKIDKAQLLSHF